MKTYLIINNSGSPLSDVIKDRIKSFEEFYFLQQDIYLVKTDKSTAQEVYEAIVKTDYASLSIVVMAIDSVVSQGYWGRSRTAFWEWLKK